MGWGINKAIGKTLMAFNIMTGYFNVLRWKSGK